MTPAVIATVIVIVLVLVTVSVAVLFRLFVVRANGMPALMRAHGTDAWRYGSIHYSSTELGYYRLASLRFRPDLILPRAQLSVGSRREPVGSELDVSEPTEVILPISGLDEHGQALAFDLCLDRGAATALLSWVEACSTEHVRERKPKMSKRRER